MIEEKWSLVYSIQCSIYSYTLYMGGDLPLRNDDKEPTEKVVVVVKQRFYIKYKIIGI